MLGLGPDNDVIFHYINPAQNLDQTFGVNLKYYTGFIKREFNKLDKDLTADEKMLNSPPEGVYTFKTELDQ